MTSPTSDPAAPAGGVRPDSADQVFELVRWAAAERKPLGVRGAGSKDGLGRPVDADTRLDLGGLAGVSLYEPEELVLSAGAGTPLEEIRQLLFENRQQLAFEPMDAGPLFGAPAGRQTIGGVIGANLSGPRRIRAGAARDHLLGFHAVSGRGERFKSGGRVMKNVTGYDLSKLMTGSFGTLAVMTDVTLKVLPEPEKIRTVLLFGCTDEEGVRALSAAAGSPHETSALAHLPAALAARSAVAYVSGAGASVTAIRIEGPAPSVEHRCAALRAELSRFADSEELHGHNSRQFWQEVRDVAPLLPDPDRVLWRLSLTPSEAPGRIARLAGTLALEALYDWAGGLVWLSLPEVADGAVRAAVAGHGHATLWRAPAETRRVVPVFQPQPAPLAALNRRIRESFDPHGILNPGRMEAPD